MILYFISLADVSTIPKQSLSEEKQPVDKTDNLFQLNSSTCKELRNVHADFRRNSSADTNRAGGEALARRAAPIGRNGATFTHINEPLQWTIQA